MPAERGALIDGLASLKLEYPAVTAAQQRDIAQK
jgi:hypothetical protein